MAVSEAKRRANAKWNKENTTMVGAQIKKDEARRFKEACSQSGVTPSRVLRIAMNEYYLTEDQTIQVGNTITVTSDAGTTEGVVLSVRRLSEMTDDEFPAGNMWILTQEEEDMV